jgi:hypothetical protein
MDIRLVCVDDDVRTCTLFRQRVRIVSKVRTQDIPALGVHALLLMLDGAIRIIEEIHESVPDHALVDAHVELGLEHVLDARDAHLPAAASCLCAVMGSIDKPATTSAGESVIGDRL